MKIFKIGQIVKAKHEIGFVARGQYHKSCNAGEKLKVVRSGQGANGLVYTVTNEIEVHHEDYRLHKWLLNLYPHEITETNHP